MHEMGVVLNVVDAVEDFAASNGIDEVKGVMMEIGEVSGVVPSYFSACWVPAVSSSKVMLDAELEIEEIPGVARCSKCGGEFNIVANDGKCPEDGCEIWDTVSGREVTIKEIYV